MKANDNIQKSLDRMLAINWTINNTRLRSHVALMIEYLRRAALWARHLQATDHWPFFDVASLIAPEIRADQSTIRRLEAALKPQLWPMIKKTCIWYLHWEALKRKCPETVAAYNLPDPFEPLIRLYERGGAFYTLHGFINVGIAGIPYKHRGCLAYETATPLVALDDGTLDRLDASTAGPA